MDNWDQVYNQQDLSQFVQIINDETETFKCMNLPGKPTEPPTTVTDTITTTPETTTVTETATVTMTTRTSTETTITTDSITESITTTQKPCATYELPPESIIYKQFVGDAELERILECIQVSFKFNFMSYIDFSGTKSEFGHH